MTFKSCIIYPHGQGGSWLSNVFYSLTNDQRQQAISKINFHDAKIYPKSKDILVMHPLSDGNLTESKVKFLGSFCSQKTQFIAYVNGCRKLKLHDNNNMFSNFSLREKFFNLSDDASWRVSEEFKKTFLSKIIIDADLMFTNQERFIKQIFQVLEETQVSYNADVNFVKTTIDNFKQTCQIEYYLGNTNELIWLGWAHNMILSHNIDIPFVIGNDLAEFAEFIKNNYNNDFVKLTKENFIII